MSQIATTIRMDSNLKREFDSLCNELGMSINTAMIIFAKAVVRSRGIPFKVGLDAQPAGTKYLQALDDLRQDASNTPDMSMDEINDMISQYRSTK